jgi:uncharacterized integral membrane protein (TIGR00697 family)
MSTWWLAPALSTVVANIIDTYTFFAVAFNNSADEYMAANWIEIAGSQVVIKIAVGLIIFLPAYGVLLRYLNGKLGEDALVLSDEVKEAPKKRGRKPKAKAE